MLCGQLYLSVELFICNQQLFDMETVYHFI